MELEIKMVKSAIGANFKQIKVLRSLGLRRINQRVRHMDTPVIRGMVRKISHMLEVKELPGEVRSE